MTDLTLTPVYPSATLKITQPGRYVVTWNPVDAVVLIQRLGPIEEESNPAETTMSIRIPPMPATNAPGEDGDMTT